jgi:hypothetical protein
MPNRSTSYSLWLTTFKQLLPVIIWCAGVAFVLGCAAKPRVPTFHTDYIPEFTSWPAGEPLSVEGLHYKGDPRLIWVEENVIVCKSEVLEKGLPTLEKLYLIDVRTGQTTEPSMDDQQNIVMMLDNLYSTRSTESGKDGAREAVSHTIAATSCLLGSYIPPSDYFHYEGRIVSPATGNYVDFAASGAFQEKKRWDGQGRSKLEFTTSDGISSVQEYTNFYEIVHWHHVMLSPNGRYIVSNNGYLYDCHSNVERKKPERLWQYFFPQSFCLSPDWSKIAFFDTDKRGNKSLRITCFNLP